MDLERAFQSAIEYETRVRDAYREVGELIQDERGQKMLSTLEWEEQGHLDYLFDLQQELKSVGKVAPRRISAIQWDRKRLEESLSRMDTALHQGDRAEEVALLRRVLVAEQETSHFYQELVKQLKGPDRELFAHFVEIEQGHEAIVQAEIDHLEGMGFWFDVQEFRLENG